MRIRLALACLGLCFVMVGCEADSPTGPSAVDLTGTWTGTITSDYLFSGEPNPGRVGPAAATFRKAGQTVTGTFSGLGDPKDFTGTVDGDTVALVFKSEYCTTTAIGTQAGRTMTIKDFEYSGTIGGCNLGVQFIVSLTKQ